MSYCNYKAMKLALLSGASIPRKHVGSMQPARTKGGEPTTRKKEEGAAVALLVHIVIASHINIESQSTYLSYSHIAKDALTSPRSARRAVNTLVASGHLCKEPSDLRECNTYRLGPATTAAGSQPSADEADSMANDLVDIIPSPPAATSPPVSSATSAAIQVANRFAELLAQPEKHSAARRKDWPAICDKMLATRSQADLDALITWVFSIDPWHWKDKLRDSGGDPMAYLESHLGSITTAMAHPTTKSTMAAKAAPHKPKHDVNSFLSFS